MNILSITCATEKRIVGRFSDGSDRQEIIVKNYIVELMENSRRYRCIFDHEPTTEEIQSAEKEDITSPVDLLQTQVDFLTLQLLELMGV